MDESKSKPANVEKSMPVVAELRRESVGSVSAPVPHKTPVPVPGNDANEARNAAWGVYVGRLALGDTEVLGKLYDESSSLVYSLVLRVLNDPSAAEEVTLDVYTQIWKNAASFDSSRGTVTAWLVTLARSRAIDRLRSTGNRRKAEDSLDEKLDIASSSQSPEAVAIATQEQRLVRAALDRLPTDQREVIELAYFSGLSQTELAEKLGQPLGTVKTRVRLGMMKLREYLERGQ